MSGRQSVRRDDQRSAPPHGAARRRKGRKVYPIPPRALAGLWRCDDKAAAARLEYAFKTLPRAKKLALLAAPEQTAEVFPALAEYACEPVRNVTLEELLNG